MAAKRALRPARFDYSRPDRPKEACNRMSYAISDWTFVAILLFLGAFCALRASAPASADS